MFNSISREERSNRNEPCIQASGLTDGIRDPLSDTVSDNVVTSIGVTTIILSKRRFRIDPRFMVYMRTYSEDFLNEYVLRKAS